jgi:hypothetical protein
MFITKISMNSKRNALETLQHNNVDIDTLIYTLITTPNKIMVYNDDANYAWSYFVITRHRYYLLAKNEHMTKYEEIHSIERV